MRRDSQDIVIGKIVGPFGIVGEVKVLVLTDFPERFAAGGLIRMRSADGKTRTVRIARSREQRPGFVLKLDGIDTRSDAEALRNTEFVIAPEEVAELDEGSFYVFDLIGLKVTSEDGRECGEVTEVLQGGANDVYVTSTGLLIPALKHVVSKIDLDKREMIIRPVPGLLPEKK
jgi:16S rRNA processing protein RimM